MVILRHLLLSAAKWAAANPRLRAKAAEVLEHRVKPRAKEAWKRTKPKITAARDELKEIARESDPRRDPKGFAIRLRDRIRDKIGRP